MQLHIFGTRGSIPTFGNDFNDFGHDTSCYAFREGNYGLILDCGSGLVGAADFLSGCDKIDVLLSHIHFDHIIGLFEAGSLFEGKDVCFYGEFSSWLDAEQQNPNGSLYSIDELFPGAKYDISLGEVLDLSEGFTARFVRSLHPDSTCMIDVWHEGKHLCYTGDYEHEEDSGICVWARDCDLLLFDGSYNSESYPSHRKWGHSTWETACEIAGSCGAKALIVTHHAPNSTDKYLEVQERVAKGLFADVSFARQGSVIDI